MIFPQKKSMQNTLIVLLGPTGVGKTDLSADIALHFGTSIISCDARQFFREMMIGTSVPPEKVLKKTKHYFIGSLSVNDYYSASLFERDVLNLLPELFAENKLALMTGGSGLYIDAVCSGIDDIPDTDPAIREKYIEMYSVEGIEGLRTALKLLDPEHYKKVDLRNYKRIIRALEICETTGLPYSSFMKKQKSERDFTILKIGLERSRDDLYARINSRVDKMVEEGLEQEARSLYNLRNLNALNTVGYKEFFEYFDGTISYDKAVELIKRDTRRYAKRQMTWWGKDSEIAWFNAENAGDIIRYIDEKITPCHTDA
jgi:tRNA dimethylallyltransferase